MPSIVIPTIEQLTAYKSNPAQLVKDQEAEEFFTVENNYVFLLRLSTAIRAGDTSFNYATTTTIANRIKTILTTPEYGYGYTDANLIVTPAENSPTNSILTFTWTYSDI